MQRRDLFGLLGLQMRKERLREAEWWGIVNRLGNDQVVVVKHQDEIVWDASDLIQQDCQNRSSRRARRAPGTVPASARAALHPGGYSIDEAAQQVGVMPGKLRISRQYSLTGAAEWPVSDVR